ncbi:MAG: site-specific integrase [Rhodospirillales bacterium]|nr:site-specific integrase [Alphaproteobacteria bacterium]MBL6947231.1 site-specific integrase [Rhodospirillales bacterium]
MALGRRYALPFSDWPLSDQQMWQMVIAEGDILDGCGLGAGWAPTTRNNRKKANGYWLYWLSVAEDLDETVNPMERITPARIGAYIKNLEGSVASSSTFVYILDLLQLAKAVAPDKDWTWFTNIKNRLWARTKPAKDKTRRIRSSVDLFQLGLDLMDSAAGIKCRYNPLASETQFRDGLMIALLAARPLRLKNLATIEIGLHLIKVDGVYWLRFDADEVKNHKHIEVPVPEILTPLIEQYCAIHRLKLLGTSTSNCFWISRLGRQLSQSTIHYHIKNRTQKAFGVSLSPHLFRDCAATSVAIEDPRHVRIAKNVLGHHSLATTQRYYDQSEMLAAGRTYQSALSNLRDTMRQESRGPYKPQPPVIDKEA